MILYLYLLMFSFLHFPLKDFNVLVLNYLFNFTSYFSPSCIDCLCNKNAWYVQNILYLQLIMSFPHTVWSYLKIPQYHSMHTKVQLSVNFTSHSISEDNDGNDNEEGEGEEEEEEKVERKEKKKEKKEKEEEKKKKEKDRWKKRAGKKITLLVKHNFCTITLARNFVLYL